MHTLEEILTELVKRWWQPRGKTIVKRLIASAENGVIIHTNDSALSYSINDLVSKDLGLWKFICQKKLHKDQDTMREFVSKSSVNIGYFPRNEDYRQLCCALIDKGGIQRFLLDNLKL